MNANLWEDVAGEWKLTHKYGSGLEVDLEREKAGAQASRVQLPEASLRGMRNLGEALRNPMAVSLDNGRRTLSRGQVFDVLAEQLGEVVSDEVIETVRADLEARLAEERSGDTPRSRCSEDLAQLLGTAALDISLVRLPDSAVGRVPLVALARLPKGSNLRFAALVLGGMSQPELAQDVGRALATVFMDPTLVGMALSVDTADGLLYAIEERFSRLSIMPTVYLEGLGKDAQLGDTLVDSIEKFIEKQKAATPHSESGEAQEDGLAQSLKIHHVQNDTVMEHKHSVVTISDLMPGSVIWRDTHLYNRGLEFDLLQEDTKPRLPRVDAAALSDVRRLLMPASVLLDVSAQTAQDIAEVAVAQLSHVGLPSCAHAEATSALAACLARSGSANGGGDSLVDPQQLLRDELVKSVGNVDGCNVLVCTTPHLVHDYAIGAFLCYGSPAQFRLPVAPDSRPRILCVIMGPESRWTNLQSIGNSFAALLADEHLVEELLSTKQATDFIDIVDAHLDHMKVVPQVNLGKQGLINGALALTPVEEAASETEMEQKKDWREGVQSLIRFAQKCSLPLILGVLMALIWSNIDMHSYHNFAHGALWEGAQFIGYTVSLHFLVNDIFMCFFFGLAIMEVTEALLPGGSLYPMKKAVNPLVATLGGVVGPAAMYALCVLVFHSLGSFDGQMCEVPAAGESTVQRLLSVFDGRMLAGDGDGSSGSSLPTAMEPCSLELLIGGWGVPTATDISLAWMFARLIFGTGHPAVNFLLLLAIVDDAIGMIIIAVVYTDPQNPVQPIWLLLVLAAIALSFFLRKLTFPPWQCYVFMAGPVAWLGLLKAHVHPALALVFIVPLMPASHADHTIHGDEVETKARLQRGGSMVQSTLDLFAKLQGTHAPLHVFAHSMQLPVDFGMFLFGLSNAGVKLDSFGGLTASVVIALILGKTLGITAFAMFAHVLGFRMPQGVSFADLVTMASLGGIGLTVALFMSNQAFKDPGLQAEAKFGSVLSVFAAVVAYGLNLLRSKSKPDEDVQEDVAKLHQGEDQGNSATIDDIVVDDVIQLLALQRRYQRRGVDLGIDEAEECGVVRARSAELVRAVSQRAQRTGLAGDLPVRVYSDKSSMPTRVYSNKSSVPVRVYSGKSRLSDSSPQRVFSGKSMLVSRNKPTLLMQEPSTNKEVATV